MHIVNLYSLITSGNVKEKYTYLIGYSCLYIYYPSVLIVKLYTRSTLWHSLFGGTDYMNERVNGKWQRVTQFFLHSSNR